jgi:hypothetical protein
MLNDYKTIIKYERFIVKFIKIKYIYYFQSFK